ncbi:Polysaccharide biosynthesis protein [Planctomycetes bacterium CA13]|uniref:Polysaccharide biosynthesis protein n=2 Tax=Novipirellula herctigrandis TaxID=2527986 RepID=A0A5C5Z9E2_9BACT|nr:Polysaccharide biosynthesis protein [Planctomycetes bacterium CA13]
MHDREPLTSSKIVPVLLICLNVVGILLGYATSILLARNLSHEGFEQYIGAIATLGLLASLGEAGFGKYALKVVPVFVANKKSAMLSGYLRFALLGTLLLSLLLGGFAVLVETLFRTAIASRVILLAFVFLPSMSLVGVTVDLLLSFRLATTATLIARIFVPATTLGLIGWMTRVTEITPFDAVLCFSISSLVGMILALLACFLRAKPVARSERPAFQYANWISNSLSFMALAFLTSWLFRSTLVLCHYIPHAGGELAMLAPAFETGCLILLLSKSTDKYFQPDVAVVLDSNDWKHGLEMRRNRFQLLGVGVLIFLGVIALYGKRILNLYGDDFVYAYPSLCLVSVGSSVWTMFSLAPTFLLFANQRRPLITLLVIHAVMMTVLTVWLFSIQGALGAATAYAITTSSLALWNLTIANRYLKKRVRDHLTATM